jgi:hypothetical protein
MAYASCAIICATVYSQEGQGEDAFLQIELARRLGIQPLTVDVACAGAIL